MLTKLKLKLNLDIKKIRGNLKRKIKKFLRWVYFKHIKFSITLFIVIGILLSCLYDGRGDLGELVFSLDKYTVYVGGFVKQPIPGEK